MVRVRGALTKTSTMRCIMTVRQKQPQRLKMIIKVQNNYKEKTATKT